MNWSEEHHSRSQEPPPHYEGQLKRELRKTLAEKRGPLGPDQFVLNTWGEGREVLEKRG